MIKTLTEYNNLLQKQIGKRELLENNKNKYKDKIDYSKNRLINIEKAQALIQQVVKETQEKIRFHIEDIVQMALNACNFNNYKFSIKFEIKRGKTEAILIYFKNDQEVDPIDETGGGVTDITAFSLRIAVWSLSKTDNIIIFDEPFKNISKNLRNQACEILQELSKKLNIQMVIVTHDEEIMNHSDKIFTVKQEKEGKYLKSKVFV